MHNVGSYCRSGNIRTQRSLASGFWLPFLPKASVGADDNGRSDA